jgi:uncharacterized protein (TIGR00106 family)
MQTVVIDVIMTVIVEFTLIPLGGGKSVSKFLVPALKEVERLGVKHQLTPTSTVFEAESIEEALAVVQAAHNAVFKTDIMRVVTVVKIDDRRDIKRSMEQKVESLVEKYEPI